MKSYGFPVFPVFFPFSFDKPTARTAQPIDVVNGSNDVFPGWADPFHVHNHIAQRLGGHFPQKPHFWTIFGKSHRFASCVLELRYRPNLLTKFYDVELKTLLMTYIMNLQNIIFNLQIRGHLSPPKPQIFGVLCIGKKWKKSPIFNLFQFLTYLR